MRGEVNQLPVRESSLGCAGGFGLSNGLRKLTVLSHAFLVLRVTLLIIEGLLAFGALGLLEAHGHHELLVDLSLVVVPLAAGVLDLPNHPSAITGDTDAPADAVIASTVKTITRRAFILNLPRRTLLT